MGALFNLPIDLPPRGSRQRRHALHEQLRSAIEEGRLAPGTRLPSTRELAAAYGISRNTAVVVFNHLTSEGYLEARRGAGVFVSAEPPRPSGNGKAAKLVAADPRIASYWRIPPRVPPQLVQPPVQFDFRLGLTGMDPFPFDVWRRLLSRTVRAQSKLLPSFTRGQGKESLRRAIARHVSATRAVACGPEDLVVTSGVQQACDLLARVLVVPQQTVVAVENPGYPVTRVPFAAAGAIVKPVPVDGEGMVVRRIPAEAKIICVTPSHQFPTGTAMSLRRRKELLAHAREHRALIVEDDYDSEYRFSRQPLDALQTLDRHESVVYVGTFSKVLFPGIRLGFMVAPPWALQALAAAKLFTDWQCSTVEQETLAAFMAEGHLGRHVRKMQRLYAARRQVLIDSLQKHFGRSLEVIPPMAGLHVTALLKSSMDLDKLVQTAREQDIAIYTLREFYMGPEERPGLIFGYGAIDERRIVEGLNRLSKLWRY